VSGKKRVKVHVSAARNDERSGHFCRLRRTCRLIEHRCAWDGGSV